MSRHHYAGPIQWCRHRQGVCCRKSRSEIPANTSAIRRSAAAEEWAYVCVCVCVAACVCVHLFVYLCVCVCLLFVCVRVYCVCVQMSPCACANGARTEGESEHGFDRSVKTHNSLSLSLSLSPSLSLQFINPHHRPWLDVTSLTLGRGCEVRQEGKRQGPVQLFALGDRQGHQRE